MFATIAALVFAAGSNVTAPPNGCNWGCGQKGPSETGTAARPARGCGPWQCGLNGPETTGAGIPRTERVVAIRLSGGERIELR